MNEEDYEVVGGIDDLFKRIRDDEISDAADHIGTTKPTTYAKMRKIYPQRVYGAIRNGKLKAQMCGCGSTIIVIDDADILFGFKEKSEETNEE